MSEDKIGCVFNIFVSKNSSNLSQTMLYFPMLMLGNNSGHSNNRPMKMRGYTFTAVWVSL